jgi:hypothetical protein
MGRICESWEMGKCGRNVERMMYLAGYLFGLLFDPKDGANTFLRNVEITMDYTTSSHGMLYSHRSEDFKPENKKVKINQRGSLAMFCLRELVQMVVIIVLFK